MENQVRIVKNAKSGLVFTPHKKGEVNGVEVTYGYLTVESSEERVSFNDKTKSSWVNVRRKSALIGMSERDYTMLADKYALGATLPGRIASFESLEPAKGFAPMQIVNKQTGEITPITSNGRQVYRKQVYVADASIADEIIQKDKIEVSQAAEVKIA